MQFLVKKTEPKPNSNFNKFEEKEAILVAKCSSLSLYPTVNPQPSHSLVIGVGVMLALLRQ